MRILVIGAGATGGFYGGKLAQAGRDVTFLVRARRAEELRRTGLVIRTPESEFTVTPKLIRAEELAGQPPFHLILLGVKAYTLEQAMADFAPAVGPETMILPMQNGMRHLELLAERFTPHNVLGGVCRIVGTVDEQGRIVQMTKLNQVAYGELDRSVTPRVQRLHETMSGCGFDVSLEENILQYMWEKWMLLSSLGAINVLGGASIGNIAAVDEMEGAGLRLERRVTAEAVAIATAQGYPPREHWRATLERLLTEQVSGFTSSMYRDYTSGSPVEAWQIIGDIVRRGRQHGLESPLLEAAYVRLRCYERSRG